MWAPPNSNFSAEPFATTGALSGDYKVHCYATPCDPNKEHPRREPGALPAEDHADATSTSKAYAHMSGIMIGLRDHYLPTAAVTPSIGTNWVDDFGDIHGRRSTRRTRGLGVQSLAISGAASGGPYEIGCTGDVITSPCPTDVPANGRRLRSRRGQQPTRAHRHRRVGQRLSACDLDRKRRPQRARPREPLGDADRLPRQDRPRRRGLHAAHGRDRREHREQCAEALRGHEAGARGRRAADADVDSVVSRQQLPDGARLGLPPRAVRERGHLFM